MAMLARSESRDGYAVRVLVVHTTEGSGTAESLRDATWWEGSSHALADERGKLLTPADGCVPYNLAAWTLRSGNRWSENIELVGFAKWKRGDWLARPLLLDACARWLATRSVARGIPLVKLSPKEYAAGRSGVIGHVDHTVGYSDGDHWDPGPDFPYDVVLPKAAAYAGGTTPPPSEEDDFMAALSDAQQLQMYEALMGYNGPGKSNFNYLDDKIGALAGPLADVRKALYGNMPEGQNNFHWLASVLLTAIANDADVEISAEAIAAAIPADIAEQVAQKLADRLAA